MKKLLNNSFLAIILLLTLQACNDSEAETIFDDAPSVRLEKKVKELEDLLQSSSEGWKITYFTDDTELGGFTYLFRFTDSKTVEMASDFGGNDDVTPSEWDVRVGSTVKLTFTTKNKIHELSDSNSGLRGEGYKGSFEFLYYGTEEDEIIFKTARNFAEVKFTKANSNDWVDIKKHKISIANIEQSPTRSVFRALKVGTESYSFSYNSARRYATSTNAEGEAVNFGVGFTPTGIVISPAIIHNEEEINAFTYDSATDKFIATQEGTEVASIQYIDAPLIPPNGHLSITKNNLGYNDRWNPILNSPGFEDFFDSFGKDILASHGMTVNAISYLELSQSNGASYVQFWMSQTGFTNFRVWWDFTQAVEGGKLFYTPTGATNAISLGLTQQEQDALQPLLDILFDPEGLYVEESGKLGQYSNDTFRFIPVSNTTYAIHFYDY